ncbi:imidazole glycerol phosphate synthase subunit HisH [Marinirhabdus gelatinilytica]|uniref:Imidazole glycerol phosphate synthase subunit HisH n=1 Tax=Marinirhabdus gelatinilytica TaxID=1703343 RepID=A0A370QA83_9FLAO|nr:imidazole glycerol phosphate synthase subunit HisH [Marinirhabdus gelatinilytica]RDK85273.1 glutamine amidotransferase [Marinirhabdus gelatinilytica]
MKLVLINYGAGNIKSLQFAFQRLGAEAILSDDIEAIQNSDRVIFPGVGEASSAMAMLRQTGLDKVIPNLTQPVLGICLGMQLMCNSSEEGKTKGLGVFDVDVAKFPSTVKVPQIGWNTITGLRTELFQNITEESYMYAVHSYFAPVCKETIATTQYGSNYSAALQKNNFYGVQFHPEKSSTTGEVLLKNFLNL